MDVVTIALVQSSARRPRERARVLGWARLAAVAGSPGWQRALLSVAMHATAGVAVGALGPPRHAVVTPRVFKY